MGAGGGPLVGVSCYLTDFRDVATSYRFDIPVIFQSMRRSGRFF